MVHLEAFAFLLSIGFNQLLVSRLRLCGFGHAASATISLTQLKVRSVMTGCKLLGGFQARNGASSVSLLQECAPKLELSYFIVGRNLYNLAKEAHRLRQLTLQKQRIAQMVQGVGIAGANAQFRAKFPSG